MSGVLWVGSWPLPVFFFELQNLKSPMNLVPGLGFLGHSWAMPGSENLHIVRLPHAVFVLESVVKVGRMQPLFDRRRFGIGQCQLGTHFHLVFYYLLSR